MAQDLLPSILASLISTVGLGGVGMLILTRYLNRSDVVSKNTDDNKIDIALMKKDIDATKEMLKMLHDIDKNVALIKSDLETTKKDMSKDINNIGMKVKANTNILVDIDKKIAKEIRSIERSIKSESKNAS